MRKMLPKRMFELQDDHEQISKTKEKSEIRIIQDKIQPYCVDESDDDEKENVRH